MASDTRAAASRARAVLHAPAVLSCRSIPDLWPMDRPTHSTSWNGIAARAALPGEAAAPVSRFQRGGLWKHATLSIRAVLRLNHQDITKVRPRTVEDLLRPACAPAQLLSPRIRSET